MRAQILGLTATVCLLIVTTGCASLSRTTLPRTLAEVLESSPSPYPEATKSEESRVIVRVINVVKQPIPDTRVRFLSLESNRVWEGWTNGNGIAPFELRPGVYAIELESKNYGRAQIARVIVQPSQTVNMTIGIALSPKLQAPDA